MAILGLSGLINSSFVNNLQKSVEKKGLTSSSNSNNSALRDSLSIGLNSLPNAISNLNSGISTINFVDSQLEKLDGIAKKLQDVVNRASQSSSTDSLRKNLNIQFKKLVSDFKSVFDKSEFNGKDLLSKDDLSDIFKSIGLDPDISLSFHKLFNDFVTATSDSYLASGEIKGKRPIKYVDGSGNGQTVNYSSFLDTEVNINSRRKSLTVAEDVKALRNQIKKNREVLKNVNNAISDNISLVRDVGLGINRALNKITSSDSADTIAQKLRSEIIVNKKSALSQAENLLPIIVQNLITG